MVSRAPKPNALAELYDGLLTVHSKFSEQTDPLWQLAVESILFDGAGLASGVTPYGEQQAERNSFKISDYRTRYGDGNRVTEFAAIETESLTASSSSTGDDPSDIEVPVTPQTGMPVPVNVEDKGLTEAVARLEEFAPEPGSNTLKPAPNDQLLAPSKFPGLEASDNQRSEERVPMEHVDESPPNSSTDKSDSRIPPNELAELYDGFRRLYKLVPNSPQTAVAWQTAIEALLYGNSYLRGDLRGYGEQQAQRNRFGMDAYRDEYGDGNSVTTFAATHSKVPTQSSDLSFPDGIELPASPESHTELPLAPTDETLGEALSLLQEFPMEPAADEEGIGSDLGNKIDFEALLVAHGYDADSFSEALSESATETASLKTTSPGGTNTAQADRVDPESQSGNEYINSDATSTSQESTDPSDDSDSIVLRDEGVGEIARVAEAEDEFETQSDEQKYEDPRAERAHQRARQRNPSTVVELGEEVTLVLQEADFSTHPATVMGKKESLAVFVQNPPQHLSRHDTVQVKIVDYGGGRTSAQAEFISYA